MAGLCQSDIASKSSCLFTEEDTLIPVSSSVSYSHGPPFSELSV